MTFDGTDLYAALIHELKNDLGLLSMTIDGIPLQGEGEHDAMVDAARLLCQGVVDRLQQALQIYKAIDQPIRPAIDAWSPQDAVHEIRDRAAALARGRIPVEAVQAPERDVPDYIEVDVSAMKGRFVRTPKLADVPFPVQMEPNMVVEYYSR
jgi:hypothetical protein